MMEEERWRGGFEDGIRRGGDGGEGLKRWFEGGGERGGGGWKGVKIYE